MRESGMEDGQRKESSLKKKGVSAGLSVELREGERIEIPLKVFKRKVMRSGLLKELRKREAYVKPSTARKLKSKAARSRQRREETRALTPDP